jgi:hypothetical protein
MANPVRTKTKEKTTARKQDIEKPLADLGEIIINATLHADTVRAKGDLTAMIKTMDRVKALKDQIGAVKSAAEELFDRIRFSLLPDLMDELEVTKMGVDGIGTCYLTSYYDVSQEDKAALRAWLIEKHLEDMISENVNAQTLGAFVNQRMREAAEKRVEPDLPLKALKLTPRTRAAIKAA